MNNFKKNIFYQTALQLINTIIPLITAPYLARVLGVSNLGIFSYTQSIVSYFILLGALGVVNYGTRTISSNKDNIIHISKSFFEIYTIQLITSVFSIALYYIYIFFFVDNYSLIFIIQGLLLFGTLLDINWLFFGVENFKLTVKRSLIIRILSFILILVLVNSQSDLWIYTMIMSGSILLSNLVLWPYLNDTVDFDAIRYLNLKGIVKHIKPNLLLFIPLLALSIYHLMDKTMLGILSTFAETGYYYNADKVINIPIGIIGGVGTVLLPRATSLIESGDKSKSDELFQISTKWIIIISVAMTFGIASISKEFVPLFFGKGYEKCVRLIIVLSPVLIIKSLSQVTRMQYLIPNHLEKIFTQSVFLGAITNLVINLILIPKSGSMGAIIATLISECVTCIWQYYCIKDIISVNKVIKESFIYFVFGIFMMILIRVLTTYLYDIVSIDIVLIFLQVIIGIVIYSVLCILHWKYKDKNNYEIFKSLLKR